MQFTTRRDYGDLEEEVYHEYGMMISPIQFRHVLKWVLIARYRNVQFTDLPATLTKDQIYSLFSNVIVVTGTPRRITPHELLADIAFSIDQIKISAMFILNKSEFYIPTIQRYLAAISLYGRDAVTGGYGRARELVTAPIPESAHESVKVYANLIGINQHNIGSILLAHAYTPRQSKIITEWLSVSKDTIQEQSEFISKAANMTKAEGREENVIELAAEHMGLIKQYKKTCARWEKILA